MDVENTSRLQQACSCLIEGDYGLIIQVIALVLFLLFFNFLIRSILLRLNERFLKQKKIWSQSFVSAIEKPLTYLIWLAAIIAGLSILFKSLLGLDFINVRLLLSLGGALAFGWFLLRWNRKIIEWMMVRSRNNEIVLTPDKLDLISKLATLVIIFLTIFLVMDVTGRSMQTLIAFGGIGGLALAFASQQVISNFFGGVMVYATQPFTIGELVNLPEKKIEGHIEDIGWYMTRIRNLEKRPIYVPNSIFAQTIVITPSRMSHERFYHKIGLKYQDIDVINQLVSDIKLMLLNHPLIDQQQKVEVYFIGFGSSSLDISISAYIVLSGSDFPAIKQDLLLKVVDIINENQAEIAPPTNIVEIHGKMKLT